MTILVVALALAIAGAVWGVTASRSSQTDSRVEVAGAKAKQDVNQEFPVPIKNNDGVEVTRIKMVLESVELRDEIIVKGQRATSVKGRTFLILNLKLTNDYSKSIDVNVKDYFRLTVNGNESELIAADIHNDPLTVQPVATKYSRIGFPINDTDNKLVLWVGEIRGDKQKVELTLR